MRVRRGRTAKIKRLVLDFTRGSGIVVAHIFYILFINRTKTGDHGERGNVGGGGTDYSHWFWCCTINRTKGKTRNIIFLNSSIERCCLIQADVLLLTQRAEKNKKKERGVASLPLLVNPGKGTGGISIIWVRDSLKIKIKNFGGRWHSLFGFINWFRLQRRLHTVQHTLFCLGFVLWMYREDDWKLVCRGAELLWLLLG